ncbi:MAG: hypothetical protein ACI4BD_00680 [Paludibacteraceae bacterium]
MKKISMLFCALVLAGTMLNAREVTNTLPLKDQSGEVTAWVCADGWASGFVQIAASELKGIQADDKILVDVSAVSSTDANPCVFLQFVDADWKWKEFENADLHQINLNKDTAVPTTVTFTLTQAMVDSLAAGQALVVKGSGYTGTAVKLTRYDNASEKVLMNESTQFDNAWNGSAQIATADLVFAQAGDELVVHVTAADFTQTNTPQISWQNGAWGNFTPSVASILTSEEQLPTDVKFTITEAFLSEIRSTTAYGIGLILRGVNYTADKITLVYNNSGPTTDMANTDFNIKSTKKIVNGQVVIVRGEEQYNLLGGRIK